MRYEIRTVWNFCYALLRKLWRIFLWEQIYIRRVNSPQRFPRRQQVRGGRPGILQIINQYQGAPPPIHPPTPKKRKGECVCGGGGFNWKCLRAFLTVPFFHPAGSHLFADSKRRDWFTLCVCVCVCVCVWRPNKAEIDACFFGGSLQKWVHRMCKRSKSRTSERGSRKTRKVKKRDERTGQKKRGGGVTRKKETSRENWSRNSRTSHQCLPSTHTHLLNEVAPSLLF